MSDEKPHRSRTAWPGPMSVAGVGEGHQHDLPDSLVQRVRLQGRAVVIFGVCLVAIGTCLVLILLDRGNARDQETQRTNDRINARFCDLLALAPADSPQADYYRAELNCPQPGVATDQLPPEIRQQLDRRPTPPAEPASEATTPRVPFAPPPGSAADPDAVPPPVNTPTAPREMAPAAPPPTTPPPPEPRVDLGPITDPVCNLAGICL